MVLLRSKANATQRTFRSVGGMWERLLSSDSRQEFEESQFLLVINYSGKAEWLQLAPQKKKRGIDRGTIIQGWRISLIEECRLFDFCVPIFRALFSIADTQCIVQWLGLD